MTQRTRQSLLAQIRNPLIFFALALLVIEAIVGAVVATSKMTPILVFASVCVMAALFLIVVCAVAFITIRWPHHLYEQVQRDLRFARQIKDFINSQAFRDTVKDIVIETVRAECLVGRDADAGGSSNG